MQIATATVDGTGKATWALGAKPAAGTIIIYDGVVVGSGGTVPAPVSAIGPTTASFTAGATSGSLITAIIGLTSDELLSSIVPNDGRVALSMDRRSLLVGLSASAAGTISYTLTTSTGRTLTIAVTANAAIDSNRLMFAGTAFAPPSQSYVIASGQEGSFSRVVSMSPDYPTSSWRFSFANWWKDSTVVTGTDQFVRAVPNTLTISGAMIRTAAGQTYPITFNGGSTSVTIAAGDDVLCDPVVGFAPTSRTTFFVDNVRAGAIGDTRTAGKVRFNPLGEFHIASADHASLVTKLGTASPGTSNGSGSAGYVYGPAFAVAKGWDGRDVVCILGDSYAEADGEVGQVVTASAVRGPIARGLDSTAQGSVRLPHSNMAIAGSRPSSFMDLGTGHWNYHDAALQKVCALNGGLPPFTVVASEHVNNECTYSVPTSVPDATPGGGANATYVKRIMTQYWAFLRSRYSGIRIVQFSPVTAVSTSDNSRYTTVAGQTYRTPDVTFPATSETVGFRWTVDDFFQAQVGKLIDGYVDTKALLLDPTTRKLKPRAYSGLLTTAVSASANTTSLMVDTAPTIGEAIVVDPRTASVEAGATAAVIQAVTGTGPYICTLTVGLNVAHAVGTVVKGIPTKGDGVHGSPLVYIEMGDGPVCSAKLSGLFRQAA